MVKDNIIRIKERVAKACVNSGRNPEEILIVGVTKNRTVDQIKELINRGIIDIGENRVQEAFLKHNQLSAVSCQLSTIKWHMVGHLQTNKVKDAVKIFDLIQSVDSLRLAKEIDQEAAKIGKIQEILVEVKTSFEVTKYGVVPQEISELVKQISSLKNIKVNGLMTIAAFGKNFEESRPYFRELKELCDKINRPLTIDHRLSTISMGMSDDFEVAIEEGSTMIRIGRAFFES